MHVCMHAYVRTDICMHVCTHACIYVSAALCLLVRCPSRVCACPPAVHHHTYLLSRGYTSCMYVCWTLCVYASTALCLFVRIFPSHVLACSFVRIFPSHVLACSSAVHHRVYLLSQGYILCMYMCSTLGMYAVAVFRMLVPCPPVTRAGMLAHRS